MQSDSIHQLIDTQLHDIRDIDLPPWWYIDSPWLFFLLIVIALIIIIRYGLKLKALRNQWYGDAKRQLRQLKNRAKVEPGKKVLSELSELLRRIAMARMGRKKCAGLCGQAWLQWLKDNDPHGFDWLAQGKILIDIPYASPDTPIDKKKMLVLINATRTWIK